MSRFVTPVQHFLNSEDGPTAVEYAIMLPLIVIVCIGAIKSIGQTTNNHFTAASSAMQ